MSKKTFSRPVQDAIDAIAYKFVVDELGRHIESTMPKAKGFHAHMMKTITPAQQNVCKKFGERVREISSNLARDLAAEMKKEDADAAP